MTSQADFLGLMTTARLDSHSLGVAPIRSNFTDPLKLYHVTTSGPSYLAFKARDEDEKVMLLRRALHIVLVAVACSVGDRGSSRNVSESEYATWRAWVAMVVLLTFGPVFSSRDITTSLAEVPDGAKTCLYDIALAAEAAAVEREKEGTEPLGFLDSDHALWAKVSCVTKALLLPSVTTLKNGIWSAIDRLGTKMQMACYCALVVYLSGKPVGENTAAISERRPKNLESKYNDGNEWYEISGNFKMAPRAWDLIGRVWRMDGLLREGFLRELALLPFQANDRYTGAVATMIALLDGAQMSHVGIITDFLRAYPFVASMPTFANEIAYLCTSAQELLSYPAEQRQMIKARRDDMFKGFNSAHLKRLTGLAVEITKQTKATVGNYKINTADAADRIEFDRWNSAYKVTALAKAGLTSGPEPTPVTVPSGPTLGALAPQTAAGLSA